jgi:hypothetical protein
MEKKTIYIKPTIRVKVIETEGMICKSGDDNSFSSNLEGTSFGGDNPTGTESHTVNAKGFSAWDTDEDYE